MDGVVHELDRLRRGWSRTQGRRIALRTHVLLLASGVLLAFGSRAFGPWPGIGGLEGRWVLAIGVGLVLLLSGLVLRLVLPPLLRPRRPRLARTLDDRFDYADALDTALSLDAPRSRAPLGSFLVAQAAGRLRDMEPARLWTVPSRWRWTRRFLAFLFVAVLLLPGVDGLLHEFGAGRGDRPGIGTRPAPAPEEPTDADRWLREHAHLEVAVPDPDAHPTGVRVSFHTDAPLPRELAGRLALQWDGSPFPLDTVSLPGGRAAERTWERDLRDLPGLAELLTPGDHEARAVLSPSGGPWTLPVESNVLHLHLEPSGGGGGGAQGPPRPAPSPEPPPPRPPPPPPPPGGGGHEPPPKPPVHQRIEVVDPLVRNGGTKVHKEKAVVAVPDPEGGVRAPSLVPLADALRDFDRVVERAMGRERMSAAERDYLYAYFRALQRSAGETGEPAGGGR